MAEDVDALSHGLTVAVLEAVRRAGVERPFVVEVRSESDFAGHLPGVVRIGSERFRDRMRAFSSSDGAALRVLWKGVATGEVVETDLEALCDRATLDRCRSLNAALSFDRPYDDPEQQRARQTLDALGLRLAGALNGEAVFARTAEPFLVVVEIGDPYRERDGLRRAAEAIGRARVEAFVRSLASNVPADARSPDLDSVRADPDALESWFRARGLGAQARRLSRDVAEIGLRLRPVERAASRLGGNGLLPPGEAWPRTAEGRPLSFLAGIDLRELPRDACGGLPGGGWLLFFADLDEDGWLGESTANEHGAPARVLWIEPEMDPVAAGPPPDLPSDPYVRLSERRVAAMPQLTLPDGYESATDLGLDPVEGEAYDDIARALRDGLPGAADAGPEPHQWDAPPSWEDVDDDAAKVTSIDHVDLDDDFDESDEPSGAGGWEPDDWILGAVTNVQGHTPEPGTVLLLHIASIEFLDGGAIQFRIPRDALAARDWPKVVAEGDSG